MSEQGPLPHLETFALAAELASFTAAGRQLGLTQAAVSLRIQALEKELGEPLFQRESGRVSLSPAGRRLYAFAEKIVTLHRQAREELSGHKDPLSGVLSLAASTVPGEHLLPGLLAPFQQAHPHVQVRVLIADTRDVIDYVERGQAQLGLVGGRRDSPHLEFRPFAADTMAVIVPAAHPWVGRRHATLNQLVGQPLIVREEGSGSRGCLVRALAAAGKTLGDLRVVLELGSNEAIKEAVQHGLGVAVLSCQAVAHEVEAGRLHTVPIRDLKLEREMFVVFDRRRALAAPAQQFRLQLSPGVA